MRRHLAGLIISAAIASPAFAKDPKSGATPAAVAAPAVLIDNFGRVNDNFYRGAQPDAQDLAELAKLGVRARGRVS